jgi:hypothetical protein
MSISNYTEFNLPRNAYAAFDALSMKQLLINRLKESGLFQDVDFEASNMSGIIDILAYSYHVLLFYLNQTSSESTFSHAELYENMNKLVSLIGYKPTGLSTSSLNITVSANQKLGKNTYSLKRYSYVISDNYNYSFVNDVTFQKLLDGVDEGIDSIGENNVLYQGTFKSYPTYVAIGEKFEQFTLNVSYATDSNKFIDGNNIHIYVKSVKTNTWKQWQEVSTLFLTKTISEVYEKRLNENGFYEIKFGNDVYGKGLEAGDQVVIFYLESDGVDGEISANTLRNTKIFEYTTVLFDEIFDSVKVRDDYISPSLLYLLDVSNNYASIPVTPAESVVDIRNNAPALFSSQNRVITSSDYEAFVTKYFSDILQNVKVCSNKDYTQKYLAYFYELGLERPNDDARVLFNQVSFSDACDFNNVYIFSVPRIGAIRNETTPLELFYAQKQSIVNKLEPFKAINQNVVIADPIYLGFDIGVPMLDEELSFDIRKETYLRVYRSNYEIISKDQIKNEIFTLIKTFFLQENNNLGGVIDLATLSYNILAIPGVKSFETVRKNGNSEYKIPKLNFVYTNPFYPNVNVKTTSQNMNLEFYEFPFYYDITNLINRIEVI